jgi:hypothetical protein
MNRSRTHIKIIFISVAVLLTPLLVHAQEHTVFGKIISKLNQVEVFGGINYSLNYGNNFVENYSSPVFINKREAKYGYSFGVGLSYSFNKRIDLNIRFQFEKKGTKSEFTTNSINPGSHNLVQNVETNNTYSYLTLSVAPRIYMHENWFATVGGYISQIQNSHGAVSWAWHNDATQGYSHSEFDGRMVNYVDPEGGITSSGFAPGLMGYEKYDHGIVLGFGRFIELSNRHSILIQLTDYFGLQNIVKASFGPPLDLEERNHSIALSVSYRFKRLLNKSA